MHFPNAKCVGLDPNLFFPVGGRAASSEELEKVSAMICRGELEGYGTDPCPAIKPCLEYALENNEDGVYGGTTSIQRKGGNGRYPLPGSIPEVA